MDDIDPIAVALAKGADLTADDVRDIEVALALMPIDAAHEAAPWAWEGVAQIVNAPGYTGDARLPEDA